MEQFKGRAELSSPLSFSMGLRGGLEEGDTSPFSDKFRSEQILLASGRKEGDREGTELDRGLFLLLGAGDGQDFACS